MKYRARSFWGLAYLKDMGPVKLLKALPDFLFPENLYCACCGDSIDRKTRIHCLCDRCIKKIQWISDDPYLSEGEDLAFDGLFSCCLYGYFPRQMVFKLKFKGARYLARPLAKLIADRVLLSFAGDYGEVKDSFDLVSFIPCSKERYLERGYNQAELLAKYVSKELEIPMKTLLLKPKETPSMRLAGRNERKTILENAFMISKKAEDLKGKRILLIDDVLTTGSTASEAARTLKDAGCKSVHVAVFASGTGPLGRQD